VFKSMDYIDNEIVSFKVINNQYLLNKKHWGLLWKFCQMNFMNM
jgi:hypothetical protein